MIEPPRELIDGLKARYGESQRAYHTWDHIQALLGHFETIRDRLHDVTAVLWALYWHDAIYDPQAGDNEDRSADLLVVEAEGLIPPESLNRAERIIRATKSHVVPDGLSPDEMTDLAFFLDIDLSILATSQSVFDGYEAQIREEYAFVPTELYQQGRAAILTGFLSRPRLYFSDHFYERWEQKARDNLSRSITSLESREADHVD